MIARRLLILLLMWLVPLYPVLAGAPAHQTSAQNPHAVVMSMASEAAHDCCGTGSSDQHTLNIDQGCEAGQCIAHCAVSLVATDIQAPVRMDYVYADSLVAPFYSITPTPPSRPPSFL